MKKLILIAITSFSGCAAIPGMPGHINEKRSSFDGSAELSMDPAFVYRNNDGFSGSDLQLALFWRSAMKPEELIIEASVPGAQSIATTNSLHFNINGEIVSFTSIDQLTNIEGLSTKRYPITWQFLDRILAAKDVRVRLDLKTTFVEGIFSDNSTSAARPAFSKFAKARAKYKK